MKFSEETHFTNQNFINFKHSSRITKTEIMNYKTFHQLGDYASDRFHKRRSHINYVRRGIDRVRQGQGSIADFQKDSDRFKKRLNREPATESQALERIIGTPDFQNVRILKKMFDLANAVGRIVSKMPNGSSQYGTGFLIGTGLVITNNHVLPTPQLAKNSFIQFDYELDDFGDPFPVQTFSFNPDKFFMTSSLEKEAGNEFSGLDFTIVSIENHSKEGVPADQLRHAVLDETLGKIVEGEHCVVIQHPGGDYKKIVLKDIRMLGLDGDFLHYESDTLPGSSGAMVVALGTGEVVALHHSGVPKKNAAGQWLRKDGTVARNGDPDELIAWEGNEGIRVSSILRAVKGIKVPEKMQKIKEDLLSHSLTDDPGHPGSPIKDKSPLIVTDDTDSPATPDKPHSDVTHPGTPDLQQRQYFDIVVAEIDELQEDWKENAYQLIPEMTAMEMYFPFSSDSEQKRLYYIEVITDENPWDFAARIQELPQIETAIPDLPFDTDSQREIFDLAGDPYSPIESTKNRFAEWNEDSFIEKWKSAYFVKDLIKNKDLESMRAWNRQAVKMPENLEKLKDWKKISANLSRIKLVQLDTGYSWMSKVVNGYNLNEDEDFIDGHDAIDEMDDGLLKFPGHGTRTASIIIGNVNSKYEKDGNYGILYKEAIDRFRLIPYRIAQSVVLIGRGKNLADAAMTAINLNTDVMFMCMGSYPRPMIYEVAKAAYDNGVIWVCAAGNEVEVVVAPALYPGTIAVAAFNPNRKPWKGSSYGSTVDVAAPGEDVYVPFEDRQLKEIMAYGNGTSYATPHVAAAAVLWKAKHGDKLRKYREPWMRVEAFRTCLRNSAARNKPSGWDTKNYGAGLLDISGLLEEKLPSASSLKYAYAGKKKKSGWDLGIIEGVHFLWKTLVRKITPGPESATIEMAMTERARIALEAATSHSARSVVESMTDSKPGEVNPVIKMYFESFE